MDTAGLSSNWKKLQQEIAQSEKSTKRKATALTTPHGKRHKSNSAAATTLKRARMSNAATAKTIGNRRRDTTEQLKDKDELPEALKTPSVALTSDILNGGLNASLEPGKYVAIDCEMVGVGPTPENSSVLARVSVVDFHGTQVYDSFVRPKEAVTDFRTPVSGITPALLRDARSFEDVQRDIAALMKGRILVGHALNNDLKVLMLAHPRRDIRDTSTLKAYREMFGRRPALRNLARRVLGVEIQSGEHSSVEDARVTMALFRRQKEAFEREALARFGPAKPLDNGVIKKPNGADANNHNPGNATLKQQQVRKKNKKGKK